MILRTVDWQGSLGHYSSFQIFRASDLLICELLSAIFRETVAATSATLWLHLVSSGRLGHEQARAIPT